jgi:hypothetical protein
MGHYVPGVPFRDKFRHGVQVVVGDDLDVHRSQDGLAAAQVMQSVQGHNQLLLLEPPQPI